MKLLVIMLCLLSERFLVHSISYQRFSWFEYYGTSIIKLLEQKKLTTSSWFVLLALVSPILLLVALIYLLLHNLLFGFVGFILNLFIFLYCLGPNNVFYPLTSEGSSSSATQITSNYLVKANSQLFAVIFWYVLAGPLFALAYRLISLVQGISSTSKEAMELTDILEWIPARLTAVAFLLVGNFQRGLPLLVHLFFASPNLNSQLLSQCGLQALRLNDTSDELPIGLAEQLIANATIVFLVFISFFTLASWV